LFWLACCARQRGPACLFAAQLLAVTVLPRQPPPRPLFLPARSAVRGLSNYMFHEAQRLAKEEVQKGNDKFDG
jgi:hypothetical protein